MQMTGYASSQTKFARPTADRTSSMCALRAASHRAAALSATAPANRIPPRRISGLRMKLLRSNARPNRLIGFCRFNARLRARFEHTSDAQLPEQPYDRSEDVDDVLEPECLGGAAGSWKRLKPDFEIGLMCPQQPDYKLRDEQRALCTHRKSFCDGGLEDARPGVVAHAHGKQQVHPDGEGTRDEAPVQRADVAEDVADDHVALAGAVVDPL